MRGIIIAKDISEELKLAVRWAPNVELYEYQLQVTLRKMWARGGTLAGEHGDLLRNRQAAKKGFSY